MEILDALEQIDEKLVDWMLDVQPATDAQRVQARQVVAQRTRLRGLIDALVLQKVKLSTPGLEPQASRLGALTTQLAGAAHEIGTVTEVLGVAAEAAGVAVTVAAFVAAL